MLFVLTIAFSISRLGHSAGLKPEDGAAETRLR